LRIALLLAALATAAPLSEPQRRWLEEEVVYLITAAERDRFRALESDAERDRFIEAFWKARDPIPETTANERREEHQRRLRHAKQVLGRGVSRPGWQTDQGRAYILLGPPHTIERHGIEGPTFPLELWFYTSEPDSGLPAAFFLLFVRKQGAGELRLYDPISDGAASLVTGFDAELMNPAQIYRMLRREVSPDLAQAAFNLDPSAPLLPGSPRPSLANTELLAKIQALPERWLLRTDYWERLAQPQEQIETRYGFNPRRIEGRAAPWWDGAQRTRAEIALWLEPQQVTVVEEAGAYILGGQLSISASSGAGKIVGRRERRLEIRLSRAQLERAQATPILILERLALAPGAYRIDATLRAAPSAEVARWSGALEIEAPAGFAIGPVIPAQRRPDPRAPAGSASRVVPTVDVLSTRDPLLFLYQVAVPAGEGIQAQLSAVLERGGVEHCREQQTLALAPGTIHTLELELRCAALESGEHQLRLSASAPNLPEARSSTALRLVSEQRPLPSLIGTPP